MAKTYAHEALERMARELGYEGEPPAADRALVALYALLAFAMGERTTTEDVHDAWALWTVAHRGRHDHPCLVPFDALSLDEMAKDESYAEAIRRVGKTLRLEVVE